MLNELELTGRARTHVVQRDDLRTAMHAEALGAYLALKAAAAADGFELEVASGFRDFEAQLRIWNGKYRGERTLYGRDGKAIDRVSLDDEGLLAAILCWSALPGASRHHWGTDVDVIDRAAMPAGYHYSLLPEEYEAGGVFGDLSAWLKQNVERHGFFLPYVEYRGGIYSEPWHLSYAPVATAALRLLSEDLIAETVRGSDVLGKEQVLARLPAIYRRYVANVCVPPIFARAGAGASAG
jgi:LAS superfamily LD-carboxypeptidase LdcB